MIPLVDLKAQYHSIKQEIDAALLRVLENSQFILGPAVEDFEAKFATYVGVKHAMGVNSGTSALHLALLACGIGPGDEVIAPAMTFVATVAAIEYAGAKPVLVDVDPVTYTLDAAKIEAAITARTKAIVPVHLYGHPAEMDPILAVARKHNLQVIEDAAQAHGAEYRGRRCGSIGVIGCFSFYPGKNLGAYGEGGAVVTDRDDLAETVRALRNWGQKVRGKHDLKGFNYRLCGMQGAVLGVKMAHIEAWTELRRQNARRLDALLAGTPGVALPREMPYARHVYHQYAVLVRDPTAIQKKMTAQRIDTGRHYPAPIHLQPCFADLGYSHGDFPVAERVAREELSLPVFPEMTTEQANAVAEALRGSLHE